MREKSPKNRAMHKGLIKYYGGALQKVRITSWTILGSLPRSEISSQKIPFQEESSIFVVSVTTTMREKARVVAFRCLELLTVFMCVVCRSTSNPFP